VWEGGRVGEEGYRLDEKGEWNERGKEGGGRVGEWRKEGC